MFKNLEGQKIPGVTFRTRRDHEWVDVTSEEIVAGKNVIFFSLPGAFTPTCSSSHVPRYNQLVPAFKAQGIDEVICVSVNDAFVMNEWQRSQNADRLTFLPDGNGEFSDAMGLLVGKEDLGFGRRSWRYSMLVRDGVVEKMSSSLKSPVTRSMYLMRTRCSSTSTRRASSHTTWLYSLAKAARSVCVPKAC